MDRKILPLLLLISLAVPLRAQNDDFNARASEVTRQVASPDAATHKSGIVAMKRLFEQDAVRAAQQFRNNWLRPLQEQKEFEAIEQYARLAIVPLANDPGALDTVLTARARALLALNKPQEAAAVAKSVFNVCPMQTTANAMLLMAECLNAVQPGDYRLTDRFRREQTAGAATRPARTKDTVLEGIKVDAAEVNAAVAKMIGEDFASLLARGNLLLVADRPAEAMTVIDRAYAVANDNQVQAASDAVARCMKAEDGAIGRANAWVLSIRPKQPARK